MFESGSANTEDKMEVDLNERESLSSSMSLSLCWKIGKLVHSVR